MPRIYGKTLGCAFRLAIHPFHAIRRCNTRPGLIVSLETSGLTENSFSNRFWNGFAKFYNETSRPPWPSFDVEDEEPSKTQQSAKLLPQMTMAPPLQLLRQNILDLFVTLPVDDYFSCDEIRCILVGQLDVCCALSSNDIHGAFQGAKNSVAIVCRQHTKAKTRYYAVSSRAETCVLFSSRSPDWKIPRLTFSLPQKDIIEELVHSINAQLGAVRGMAFRKNDLAEKQIADEQQDDEEILPEASIRPASNGNTGQQPKKENATRQQLLLGPCSEDLLVEKNPPHGVDVTPPGILKVCKGFVGEKVDDLFKQSFIDGPLRHYQMHTPFPRSFALPACVATNKGVRDLHFEATEANTWKLVSKTCTQTFIASHNRQVYCPSCSQVSNQVRNLCKRVSTVGGNDAVSIEDNVGRISARGCLQMATRPEKFKAVLDDIRRKKDRQMEKVLHQSSVCRMRLQKAIDCHKESVSLESVGDAERSRKAMELLKPLITRKYGLNSDAALIWEQTIEGMGRPIESKPRYSDTALCFGIELAAQTKADVYEKVSLLLNLPPRNHCKRVQRQIVYGKDGCYKIGFQKHTAALFRKVAISKKLLMENCPLQVCLAFDSMIMKKGLILSTRNIDKGRLIGCVLSEDLTCLENLFENYVQNVTLQAKEKGETIFDQTISDPFQHNREHLVCYAKCMIPGVELSFIAGAWNLPACRKVDLVGIVHDVMLGLYNYQFEARVITCDNAQCNEGFLKTMASLRAKDILPGSLLEEHDLTGDILVAMHHPITKNPVIYISDPPHCVKRLAGAVRTRDLHYSGCPLKGQLLYDVWQEVQNSYGGDASLIANRKYKMNDFIDGGGFASMNVASAARLLSATSKKMLDEVANNPILYPMASKLPENVDRKEFFSKLGELCTLVNGFFDLCNGKEGSNQFVRFHKSNGLKYQKKFLHVLQWFGEWERDVMMGAKTKEQRQEARKHFIATETYRSLKYACYGFASLIQYECIENVHPSSISPCKINQDICEHHFANVRRNCASHANPNEVECMASLMKSAFFRMESIKKSNCGVLRKEHQRSTVPIKRGITTKKNESLSRMRSQFGKTSKRRRILQEYTNREQI